MPARPAAPLQLLVGTRQLQVGEHLLAYALRRSTRRSIGFVVNDDGLTITAPRWMAQTEIEAAIHYKQKWILTKLGEWQQRKATRPAVRTLVCEDGATLPYLGREITLRLQTDTTLRKRLPLPALNSDGTTLLLWQPPQIQPEALQDLLHRWLQDEARHLFAQRLELYADRLGTRHRAFALTSASTRWGSCTADGKIRLHWRLIHFPLNLIDYVVAHELAHLREMNHSPRFWETVASLYPDYLTARQMLKQHPPEHLPRFE